MQTAMVEYLLEHGAVIGFCDDYMSHCAKVNCVAYCTRYIAIAHHHSKLLALIVARCDALH
jgi:hypothetical protein